MSCKHLIKLKLFTNEYTTRTKNTLHIFNFAITNIVKLCICGRSNIFYIYNIADDILYVN